MTMRQQASLLWLTLLLIVSNITLSNFPTIFTFIIQPLIIPQCFKVRNYIYIISRYVLIVLARSAELTAESIMKFVFLFVNNIIADRSQSVEFYDFLQVNTDHSNKSEVTDNAKRDDEEVNQDAVGEQSKDGNFPFIDFLSVGSSELTSLQAKVSL